MSRLLVAAEDNFALVDLSGPRDDLLPTIEQMELVATAAHRLTGHWHILWDLRELGETVYNDTIEAWQGIWSVLPVGGGQGRPMLLVPPGRSDEVRDALDAEYVDVAEMLPKRLPSRDVALEEFFAKGDVFDDVAVARAFQANTHTPEALLGAMAERFAGQSAVAASLATAPWLDEATADDFITAADDVKRVLMLDQALRQDVAYSTLTQLAVQCTGGHVHVTPYHGGGLHQTVGSRDEAVLLRPARVHRRYWATFRTEIMRLEALLNAPRVKEREIERLLEDNPLFLNSLGYEHVYHQIVLPRDGAADLRPDVIAEPAGSEWAEIVELKLPTSKVVVGRNDRAAMSAMLTEAVAQLREYAAFFDDRAAAAPIEERLGIRCYRPKLTVIIGRDPTRFSDEQRRRALTAHPDLRVVTYDDLLRAARTRLLL